MALRGLRNGIIDKQPHVTNASFLLLQPTFHASNQAGNQLAYQHLGSSVQPSPYMGRATATGHFHDPQQPGVRIT